MENRLKSIDLGAPRVERDQQVLRSVVLSYIRTATPVGSRSVAKEFGFTVSAATVRNVMADLAEQGYLTQPHASAGRVPTQLAFRCYVDWLLEHLDSEHREEDLRQKGVWLTPYEDVPTLLQETSRMLSHASRYAGMVVTPRFSEARLQHLEFVRLRRFHILAILVTDEGFVLTKTLECDEDLPQDVLTRLSRVLHERFQGKRLPTIQQLLTTEVRADKTLYDRLIRRLMTSLLGAVGGDQPQGEVYLGGLTSLFDLQDFSDLNTVKALVETFEEKATLLRLLERCVSSEGVQVFIGREAALPGVEDCSFVVSTYHRGGHPLGALGVIGPMRMDYGNVIPLVQYTAKLVTQVLEAQT